MDSEGLIRALVNEEDFGSDRKPSEIYDMGRLQHLAPDREELRLEDPRGRGGEDRTPLARRRRSGGSRPICYRTPS